VTEVLADQEGIRALLDHQHRCCVLQDMRVLERLAEPGFLGDGFEELVDGDTVELGGFLAVEDETVGVGSRTANQAFNAAFSSNKALPLTFSRFCVESSEPSGERCGFARC